MGFTLGVDIGGTFTDLVVMDVDGSVSTYKAPTTPAQLLDGVLACISDAAATRGMAVQDFLVGIERIAHGTTAATNAYLERRGAKVALLTTRGFEDTIFMQRQLGMTAGLSHAELTDYSKRRVPVPLCPRELVFGIRERVDYRGEAIGRLVEADIRKAAVAINEAGVAAVAICFLWSFKNPTHERRAAEILREELPNVYLSVSSELVPRLGEYERTATTLVNAYLGPGIAAYMGRLEDRFGGTRLLLLDSGGSVMAPAEASRAPVRLLLSGPSGGVTASQALGADLGHHNVITFDMGGTSTDVGIIVHGRPLHRLETEAEGYHLLLPMVDIRTIGAGGGSIALVEEGGYLRVGPESAGADPGPACYGRGGRRPTVTDADLVLGILDPANFLGGRVPLHVEAAREAIRDFVAKPLHLGVEAAAAGIKRIVDARMADLLHTVTIEQGHDPGEFILYAFGGAGPTHAPAFALEVVDAILVPATQAVHSALGAIASDLAFVFERTVPMRLSRTGMGSEADPDEIEEIFTGLETRARSALTQQDVPQHQQQLQRIVEVRFIRQSKTLPVLYQGAVHQVLEDFLRLYAQRYGAESVPEIAGFELVTFTVRGVGHLPRPKLARHLRDGSDPSESQRGVRSVYDLTADAWLQTAVYDGTAMHPGYRLLGPAVVQYPNTTIALGSGQEARVDELLGLTIRRAV